MKIEDIKKLREMTFAGYVDCKKALEKSGGDFNLAVKYLREIGHKVERSHAGRPTDHGVIEAYIHPGNRIGAMVEIRCETDFVAKTQELKTFAREMAMQVAAMSPKYVSRRDVPEELIENERAVRTAQHKGKDVKIKVDAQMERWFAEVCLLEQAYVKDNSMAIKDLLSTLIASVGETCRVAQIQRWEIGS